MRSLFIMALWWYSKGQTRAVLVKPC